MKLVKSALCCMRPQNDPRLLESLSEAIERKMKQEKEMEKKKIRILLLGPGDSGKTTIMKQIKKMHPESVHDSDDAHSMKQYIQESCVSYIKTLCVQSQRLNQEFNENTKINDAFETLRRGFECIEEPYQLTADTAQKIKILWADDGIRRTLQLRHYYQIHDNVAYFLDKIEEVADENYVPTYDDRLRIRYRSTGFHQTKIISKGFQFEFIDAGGQRCERKKWMKFVSDSESINAVVYVVAISEYDMNLYENGQTNRLHEAIELLNTIMSSGKFVDNKPVLLLFNKYDLFKKKIKKIPITVAFDDFPMNKMDPNNEDDVIRFIACKFFSVFQDNNVSLSAPLHILRTTALDIDSVNNVFGSIVTDMFQHNLTCCDLMQKDQKSMNM